MWLGLATRGWTIRTSVGWHSSGASILRTTITVLLSQSPTNSMRQQGWTEDKLADLRSLVGDWRSDFVEDGDFTRRQHRIMIRWFLDADLDFDAVKLLMATVDNTVYEALGLP